MRQRVQVPFRTLVRVSELRIFIIIYGFARLEPPTRSCSARGEPGACPWWASPRPDTSEEGLCPAENRSGALPVSAHGNILGTICRLRVRPRRSHVGTERQDHGISGAAATRRRRHNGARHLASGRSTGGGEVRAQLKALAVLTLPSPTVPGAIYLPFGRNVQDVTPEDVRLWLSRWDRRLKTKANDHGFLFAVFAWAVEEHALITVNPCAKTAPSRPTIKAEQPERTWLAEAEFKTFTDTFMAEDSRDLLRVMVGTGLRFGEVTALWVEDIGLTKRTLSVRKAWNRQGEDGQTQIPQWLTKRISDKHEMRGHYLGIPKTSKSRRTITIAPSVVTILRRAMKGKSPDDFVFTTAARSTSSAALRWTGGRPIHAGDFSDQRWLPALKAAEAAGFAKRFTPHDLRHTHVAWLIAAGVPLPNIQQRLGHESITTTIDTYGHLLPQGNDLIDAALDAGLGGEKITISD